MEKLVSSVLDKKKNTYYIACFQVNPSKLFTAAPILNTKLANQKLLTESEIRVRSSS